MKLYIPAAPEDVWAVLDFIAARVRDFEPSASAAVMASVKGGEMIGAVAYQNYRKTEIEMVCAGKPGWLNKTAIRAYFAYPFLQLGCRRVSAIIHRKNKRSRKFAERLGFKMEGVHRKAMADGGDAISYGMLKENCRWIGQQGPGIREAWRASTFAPYTNYFGLSAVIPRAAQRHKRHRSTSGMPPKQTRLPLGPARLQILTPLDQEAKTHGKKESEN